MNSMEIVPLEDVKREMERHRSEISVVLEYTKSMQLRRKKEAEEAVNCIARARSLLDQIEKSKRRITRDSREYITKINNIAKEFVEPLMAVESTILDKIDSWKKQELQKTEVDREEEEVMSMDFNFDVAPSFESFDKIKSAEAIAYEQIEYSFEVTDISLVPTEYLKVNEEKFEEAIKNGIRSISGLKIKEEIKTRIRRSRK